AAAGDWAGAIDSYAQFLGQTSPEEYRDKKDFTWILAEYEKQQSDKNFAPLKQAADAAMTQHKDDAIYTWRLHRLLSAIAEKAKDADTQAKELDQTIAAYPKVAYADHARHSSLQHLYNQRAMLIAQTD